MKTPRYLNVPGRRVMLPRNTSGLFTLRWLALNHQPRNVKQRVITSELPAKASGREGPWARGERPGHKSGSPRPYRQRRIRYSCYRLLGSRQFTRSSHGAGVRVPCELSWSQKSIICTVALTTECQWIKKFGQFIILLLQGSSLCQWDFTDRLSCSIMKSSHHF